MSLVRNERVKLTANLLNTVAAATLVTGVIGPNIALSYGLPGPGGGWAVLLITVVWLLVGSAIHYLARYVLKGLQP